MYLIASDIVRSLQNAIQQLGLQVASATMLDWQATTEIAENAQTILFPADLLLGLSDALGKFADMHPDDYRLPFPSICLQFDQPIPEHIFLSGALAAGVEPDMTLSADEDAILALLLAEADTDDGRRILNAVAWYRSGSVNRVGWYDNDKDPIRQIAELGTAAGANDKRTIQRMAYAAVTFLNAENVLVERQQAPAKVNRKRKKQGKRELKPFYTCHIHHTAYDDQPTQRHSGSRHGHTYAVRGHFRRLRNGKVIWVRAHFRGLEHAEDGVKSKVYKFDN